MNAVERSTLERSGAAIGFPLAAEQNVNNVMIIILQGFLSSTPHGANTSDVLHIVRIMSPLPPQSPHRPLAQVLELCASNCNRALMVRPTTVTTELSLLLILIEGSQPHE